MVECNSRVEGVRYCDGAWWDEFITNYLNPTYSRLAGLLKARDYVVSEYVGKDLGELLSDPSRRDFALKIALGGLRSECVGKAVDEGTVDKCFSDNAISKFYRWVLGIGLDNNALTSLINGLSVASVTEVGKDKAIKLLGLKLAPLEDIKLSMDRIYDIAHKPRPSPENYEIKDPVDLVRAFNDFLNSALKLLPLYNPFTFFIQSLNYTPRPYLTAMYGEELFSKDVEKLMSSYGVKLITRLRPGINEELDEKFAVVGHERDSFGDLIMRIIQNIYDITSRLEDIGSFGINDEFRRYVSEYRKYITEFHNELSKILNRKIETSPCTYRVRISVKNGTVGVEFLYRLSWEFYWHSIMDIIEKRKYYHLKEPCGLDISDINFKMNHINYKEFIELLGPLMFLGLAWLETAEQDSEGTPIHTIYLVG